MIPYWNKGCRYLLKNDPVFKKYYNPDHYLKLNNNNFTDLDNELICKSGINWDNDVFFDISKNHIYNTNNKCAHGIDFHEIYNSY